MNAKLFRKVNNRARNAASNLQDTFAQYAICLMMTLRGKRYFTVINVGSVELAGEKTSYTAILVDAVSELLCKETIRASKIS